ncbi:MAG: beta-N-acetylhexosaminidase [Pseudomonadota bacterium]|nr:beta-N-acetylhexosaminidase [Pseudomonadota bacterium]
MKYPIIFGCSGTIVTKKEKFFFEEFQPLGFILFQRNCKTKEQVIRLINDLRETVGNEVPILIDQEGGRVQRLGPPLWNIYPPAEVFGRIYKREKEKAIELIKINSQLIASELVELGINVNCSPVIDLREKYGHSVIGDRALSDDPETVILLGKTIIEGLESAGISAVIKHIPGHGRAEVDSHESLPKIDKGETDLLSRDFRPFVQLNNAVAAMTGHLLFPRIDPIYPVTFSKKIVKDVIRNLIGFKGVLISDDLSMNALTGAIDYRLNKALEAGCDIALHCNGDLEEMELIAKACPSMSNPVRERIEILLKNITRVSENRKIFDTELLKVALNKGLKEYSNLI